MKNIFTKISVCLLLVVGCAGVTSFVGGAQASAALTPNQQAVCDSIGSGKDCKDTTAGGGTQIDSVLKTVVRLLGFVAGFLAVVMIIVSGIKYTTSGGDSSKIASAKTALIYAIVGIVIVALSQVIVRFVLSTAANTDRTTQQSQQQTKKN